MGNIKKMLLITGAVIVLGAVVTYVGFIFYGDTGVGVDGEDIYRALQLENSSEIYIEDGYQEESKTLLLEEDKEDMDEIINLIRELDSNSITVKEHRPERYNGYQLRFHIGMSTVSAEYIEEDNQLLIKDIYFEDDFVDFHPVQSEALVLEMGSEFKRLMRVGD